MNLDSIPECFYRVSVKALVLDETRTKFLIVQEDDGEWELPGGGLDWGEDPHEGLKREIQEEMGLEVASIKNTPSYFLTQRTRTHGTHYVNVLYETTLMNLDFTSSSECVAIRFVDTNKAKELPLTPNVAKFLDMFDHRNH